jgi:hypothetical protein
VPLDAQYDAYTADAADDDGVVGGVEYGRDGGVGGV